MAIKSAFIEGSEQTEEVGDLPGISPSERSVDWRLAESEMARDLCHHLIGRESSSSARVY